MGKTTLLEHAAMAADGMRTLEIRGIEAEREFGFAGLQRLFVPLMDLLPHLPERQCDALSSAFGLASGPPADRFLVGLAALTLLTDAAAGEPVVCLVDDAQWLDQESLDALAFVGRRVLADSVALVFATRIAPETEAALEGLPRIDIGGLPHATALELISDAVATPIDATIADRIVNETGGCPLALEELAKNLSSSTFAGGAALPEPLPISGRLESHFLARAEALPPATQLLALLAAAETSGDPNVVWRAASELGLSQASADPAEAAGLLTWSPHVEFRHPLVRSAVYGGAVPGDRRRVHAALAAATDPELDPDGRARHLAAAAIGPDEAVAAELERAARRARSRGGYAADAALMSRSAELTPDPVDQARRRLQAAQIHYLAGAPNVARTLLDVATPGLREPLLQAQAKKLDAALNTYIAPATIAAVFLRAAQDLEPLDRDLAREAYADALGAVAVSGHLTRHTTPLAVARAALDSLPPDEPDPTMNDLLIEATGTRIASGYTAAVPAMRRLVAACLVDDVGSTDRVRWWTLGPQVAGELWDAEGFRALSQRLEQAERERGALSGLRSTVSTAGNSEIWAGRFAAAAARATPKPPASRWRSERTRSYGTSCGSSCSPGRDRRTKPARWRRSSPPTSSLTRAPGSPSTSATSR